MAVFSKILLILVFVLAVVGRETMKILRQIDYINSVQTSWKAETNYFSHLSMSEIKIRLGMKLIPAERLALLDRNFDLYATSRRRLAKQESVIPINYDARKEWRNCSCISSIRDQSVCGSCWAVSTATAFTGRLCIASKGKMNDFMSSEYLLTCCKACTDGGDGCQGGFLDKAWKHCMSPGIVSGGDYGSEQGCMPYSTAPCQANKTTSCPNVVAPKCARKCTNKKFQGDYKKDHRRCSLVYRLLQIKDIQLDIMTHGPLTIGMHVYEDFLSYKSGIYMHVMGKNIGGHAGTLIGWGDINGSPYWLVANSWNTSWGDKGTFKIRKGVNECGIESYVIACILKY